MSGRQSIDRRGESLPARLDLDPYVERVGAGPGQVAAVNPEARLLGRLPHVAQLAFPGAWITMRIGTQPQILPTLSAVSWKISECDLGAATRWEFEVVNYVTLRDTRDEGGSRHLGTRLKDDGALLIEGQDLGPGVESFFVLVLTEYEWALIIRPPGVMTLKLALACDDGVLAALRDRFSGDAAVDLQPFLDDNGVPYEPWSRVGD